jgi:hypothetical protein
MQSLASYWLEIERLILIGRLINWFDYLWSNKQALDEDATLGILLARNLKDPFPLAIN